MATEGGILQAAQFAAPAAWGADLGPGLLHAPRRSASAVQWQQPVGLPPASVCPKVSHVVLMHLPWHPQVNVATAMHNVAKLTKFKRAERVCTHTRARARARARTYPRARARRLMHFATNLGVYRKVIIQQKVPTQFVS